MTSQDNHRDDIDFHALRRHYAEEQAKRLHAGALDQYHGASGEFEAFGRDAFVETPQHQGAM